MKCLFVLDFENWNIMEKHKNCVYMFSDPSALALWQHVWPGLLHRNADRT